MKYDDIRNSLNTLDIVLFSGKGFISWLIRIATKSKWSHVGIVYRISEIDRVLIMESTSLGNQKDIFSKKKTKGFQVVALKERIENYKGSVAIRRLDNFLLTEEVRKTIKDIHSEFKDKKYEINKLELAFAALPFRNKKDLSSLFCSEAVAEIFIRLGLLKKNKPSNEYTPADFSKNLNLLTGQLSGIINIEI